VIALSDDQLTTIMRAAGPLDPHNRALFLEDVAHALQGREIGDGTVARICAEVQKRYWRALDLSRGRDYSRYRR
jgi:hypothetical protein